MLAPVRIWNAAGTPRQFGTVGCLVWWMDKPGVLSASHVLAPPCRSLSFGANQEICIDVGTSIPARATLVNWTSPITMDGQPGSSLDAAFAVIDQDCLHKLKNMGALPLGVRTVDTFGEPAHFFGAASTRLKDTIIHDAAGDVMMGYKLFDGPTPNTPYEPVSIPLHGLIQCDAINPSIPGDSGCLLVDAHSNALGLLVGTDPSGAYPYFVHLQPVLDLFGLRLMTPSNF